MSGILGSRYGEYFQAAILLNPCLNFPFMSNITDIPDWVSSSILNKFHDWNLGNGEYKQLYDASVMSNPMTIPTLLLLGAKDLRVPYQAGLAFHAQQIANGKEIETYVYPDSSHGFDESLHTVLDIIVKVYLYIEKYLD